MKPQAQLRDKEIKKISSILSCPVEIIQKLNAMNYLDTTEIRSRLILNDWKNVKKNGKYKTFQIVEALMNEYQVSRSKIENIIYAKKNRNTGAGNVAKEYPKANI